ncbi:MAG: RagB/SusD family nutrient uptake outer membrane protein [Prevotellaceae bacterium]|nr:RagB/SusD family nutrient uptake outer membrane protein [Prevotellaceae bacterium]
MKNTTKYCLLAALMLSFASCEDFLDTESFTQKNTGNFPVTETDAEQMMAAIYNYLGRANGANGGYIQGSFYLASELACDDRLGGAGPGDQQMQAIDLLREFSIDQTNNWWIARYQGVNRANSAIENLDKCEVSDTKRQKYLGEAYFLRAFFYYELASMFEKVPLHLTTEAKPLPQASPDATWGQIIADLKKAIELMPAEKTPASDAGHVDKYVAEAMMGRAFLFYTGFYGKTEVALPDGSTVNKQQVIGWIDDCVENSGYELVPDFRNLWAYANRLTRKDYPFMEGVQGAWPEDDGGINPEAMFAIKFNKHAGWGWDVGFTNGYAVFTGMRGGDADWAFPVGQGWGAGPVAPNLWNDWPDGDLRKRASICEVSTELPNAKRGGGWGDWIQETGYFFKKGASFSCKDGSGARVDPFDKVMYNTTTQWDINIIHDLVLIRFADVLLMQSELKEDATGMNRVRARAGLAPIGYSLEALQAERRYELAFEGTRWNDIRRWGAEYAKAALEKQAGEPIFISGLPTYNKPAGSYSARYDKTRGFFPIPETQITLADGLYVQNPGWDVDKYTSWDSN